MPRCSVCHEPLKEVERVIARLCVICAHRTLPAEPGRRRIPSAGVIDSA